MENFHITAAQISASSQFDANLPSANGRLHFKGGYGAWAAAANDLNQWFQIDLRVEANVTFVATQGRYADPNQRVTQYKLQYSRNGMSFQFYKQTGEISDMVRSIHLTSQTNQVKQKGNRPTNVGPRVGVVRVETVIITDIITYSFICFGTG